MIPYRIRVRRGEPHKPNLVVMNAQTAGESMDLAARELRASMESGDWCWIRIVDVSMGQVIFLGIYDPCTMNDVRCCEVCGCSDEDCCQRPCSWAGPNLCSSCVGKAIPGGPK